MKRDRVCRWLIAAAARMVPAPAREEWLREWDGELWWWRRSHSGPEWDAELLRRAWGSFPDAYCMSDARALARGPAFCLAAPALLLLIVIAASGGLAITRSLVAPLPYSRPERIVTIARRAPMLGYQIGSTASQLPAWRSRLLDLAAYTWDGPRARVSAEFFTVLGAPPLHGRVFGPGDSPGNAVLSYRFWRDHFAADDASIGRTATIGERKVHVLGVMPEDFWFLSRHTEMWTLDEPGRVFGVVARLLPNSTAGETEAALRESRHPKAFSRQPMLHSVRDSRALARVEVSPLQDRARQPLYSCAFGALLAMAVAAAAAVRWARSPRYALFFLGKSWLALAAVALAVVEFTPAASLSILGGGDSLAEPAGAWLTLTAAACVLYWAFADQRKRCRSCLNELSRGVRVGRPAAILFDYSGEELVCGCGHGALYIPEVAGQNQDRWTPLDESWRGLFGSHR